MHKSILIHRIALAMSLTAVIILYAFKIKREPAIKNSTIQENNIQSNEKEDASLTPEKVRESLEKAGADMNAKSISPEDVKKKSQNFWRERKYFSAYS